MSTTTKAVNNVGNVATAKINNKVIPTFDPKVFVGNEVPSIDLYAKLEAARITTETVVPKPEIIIGMRLGGLSYILCTRQSISLIKAKQKVGKTGLAILLAAVVLNGSLINNEFKEMYCDSKGVVIIFDCEQGLYYGSLTFNRIAALAPPENLRYYNLRPYNAKQRLQLIKSALEQEQNISLVIIDGLRDILRDFNDPVESAEVIGELMALSVQHNCHIMPILHTNKADNNAKGHAGAEATNKSETVFNLEKGKEDGITIVSGEYTRGLGFPNFTFNRDDNGTPQLANFGTEKNTSMKTTTAPQQFTKDKHESLVSAVFDEDDKLSAGTFMDKIGLVFEDEGLPNGRNKLLNFRAHWLAEGLIIKHGDTNNCIYENAAL